MIQYVNTIGKLCRMSEVVILKLHSWGSIRSSLMNYGPLLHCRKPKRWSCNGKVKSLLPDATLQQQWHCASQFTYIGTINTSKLYFTPNSTKTYNRAGKRLNLRESWMFWVVHRVKPNIQPSCELCSEIGQMFIWCLINDTASPQK